MPLNRFLKYINILIGLTVLSGLGCAYWYLYRPLPATSGSISAPTGANAVVVRDELGAPHIEAATEADALFLQGFVTAQDRMFQLDLLRRRAAGELAEIFGEAALANDRESRKLGLRRLAEKHYGAMSPEDRRVFTAYARGINFYLEANAGRPPTEFRLLGYAPRPWRVVDSLLVGLDMYRTLSSTWRTDLLRQAMAAEGDIDKVERLFPVRSPLEGFPGSNAWAISGERTASGAALLASDPHLDHSAPSPWYQIHLKAGALNVVGVAIPGLPGVQIGHNEEIAWASTNLRFDVQDLYVERLNPATGQFVHRGRILQARRETERIRVSRSAAVTEERWVTNHGPVVISLGGAHVALRWSAGDSFQYPYLRLNRARNWDEFRASLREFSGPAQSFVYADRAGNIGMQAAGRLPIRNHDGGLPVDGQSGAHEWSGIIPFDELPSLYNPESGLVVSANGNPFPDEYPYRVAGEFAPGYRERRIRVLLAERSDWSLEEMGSIQTDIHDAFLHFLAGEAVAAYETRSVRTTALNEAIGLLREWDGAMNADSAAPLVATLLFQHLRGAVAEQAAPSAGLNYGVEMSPAVIEALLRERPEGWFNSYEQLLLRSLVDAIEEGQRMQGRNTGEWKYGQYNRKRLSIGPLERLPILGRRLRLETIPLSGSSNTIQQNTPRLGPSMRMLIDTGNWDRSTWVLTLGESGHRLSSHYQDQRETYAAGAAFPMDYQQVSGSGRIQIVSER